MRKRSVVGTSLELTELSFGAASLGNLYRTVTDVEARFAVDKAWDLGIRYFDTAPHYGLGLSERRLGEALADRPRNEFVVSSKVGRLLVPNDTASERDDDIFEVRGDLRRQWDFSYDGISRSVEATLERMKLDRIDILFLHDPDVSGIPDAARSGAAALIELRNQGVVDAVGIGSNDAAAIAELLANSNIDLAMVAGRFTLMEPRGADAVFEAAGDRSIIAAGVFNSGLLAQRSPSRHSTYNYRVVPESIFERATELAHIAEQYDTTLPAAALQYALRDPRVASVTAGMATAREVTENVSLLSVPVSSEAWHDLLHR